MVKNIPVEERKKENEKKREREIESWNERGKVQVYNNFYDHNNV